MYGWCLSSWVREPTFEVKPPRAVQDQAHQAIKSRRFFWGPSFYSQETWASMLPNSLARPSLDFTANTWAHILPLFFPPSRRSQTGEDSHAGLVAPQQPPPYHSPFDFPGVCSLVNPTYLKGSWPLCLEGPGQVLHLNICTVDINRAAWQKIPEKAGGGGDGELRKTSLSEFQKSMVQVDVNQNHTQDSSCRGYLEGFWRSFTCIRLFWAFLQFYHYRGKCWVIWS